VRRGSGHPVGRSGRTTVTVSEEVKRLLDEVKAELRARTYDELLRRLLDIYREYRRLSTAERVRGVVCNEFLEARGSLSAWARLLARYFNTSDEVAAAMGYLVPDPREPSFYVVSRERCISTVPAGVAPTAEGAAAAAPEQPRAAETVSPEPPRPGPAATPISEEVVEIERADEMAAEEYVKTILVPMLRERAGSRTVWELRELRKLLESLTPLPTIEVLNILTKLGLAELRGNQVVLRL